MEIGLQLLDFALPVIGVVVAAVGVVLVKKLFDKFGIETSEKVDALIDKYVRIGVTSAQRVARLKIDGRIHTGESKKSLAVKTVLDELKQSGIRKVATELVEARIEAYLEDNPEKKVTTTSPTSTKL